MAALCLGALSYALAQTAIAPALSSMARELDRSAADVAWVVTAYFVAAAVLTPVLGRLGDLLGKRQVLVATLLLFGVGSALSAMAPTLELIVVGRILQGAGGGIFPLAFGIVRDVVPQHRVASAVGTVSALAGVGAGAGLVLGGVVSDAFGYRFVFWTGALPALAAALLAHKVLPARTVRAPGRIDVLGALGLALGLALPLLAMTQAVRWGWASPATLALLGAGLLVLVLWTARSRRVEHPLIDLATLRRPQVRRTNAATFLTSVSMYVPFLLVPTVAQAPTSTSYGLGLGATAAGLLLVPGSLLSLVSGPLTGFLVRRRGTRVPLLLGAGLQACGLFGMSVTHDSVTSFLLLAPVTTFGTGLAFAAMPNLIFESVEVEQTGQATGVNAVVRTIGVAMGAQITAVLLAALTTASTGLPDDRAVTAAFAAGGTASLLGLLTGLRLARRPADRALPAMAGAVAVPAEPTAAKGTWSVPEASPDSPLRADARRNLERVLIAATAVFVERGLDATVGEIAQRAGVGKATVYRSFPTRADLLAATVLRRLAWYEDRLRVALEQDDVGAAIQSYVEQAFLHLRTDRGLGDVLRSLSMPSVREAAERLRSLSRQLVERGVAAEVLRSDATEDDLRLLVSGLNRALVESGSSDADAWRRAAELVLSALRR